jgi:hypothetical protein
MFDARLIRGALGQDVEVLKTGEQWDSNPELSLMGDQRAQQYGQYYCVAAPPADEYRGDAAESPPVEWVGRSTMPGELAGRSHVELR